MVCCRIWSRSQLKNRMPQKWFSQGCGKNMGTNGEVDKFENPLTPGMFMSKLYHLGALKVVGLPASDIYQSQSSKKISVKGEVLRKELRWIGHAVRKTSQKLFQQRSQCFTRNRTRYLWIPNPDPQTVNSRVKLLECLWVSCITQEHLKQWGCQPRTFTSRCFRSIQ